MEEIKTKIIDGKKIKDEILIDLKIKVEQLSFSPIFCDILVGDDPVQASYVRIKSRAAESVGIKFKTLNLRGDATTEEIIYEIENLNRVPHMCGIIVQLPLPLHIDTMRVLNAIDPKLDVDCLGKENNDLFYSNKGVLLYPTAIACIKIIDTLGVDLKDKNIVVLGQGKLVGLPVSYLLKLKSVKVSTINSKTENSISILKNADLIISAIGRANYINKDLIKNNSIILDAGTSEDNGAIMGDVDVDSVYGTAAFVSPTPGGVGPVTVAMLLNNVLLVAQNKNGS